MGASLISGLASQIGSGLLSLVEEEQQEFMHVKKCKTRTHLNTKREELLSDYDLANDDSRGFRVCKPEIIHLVEWKKKGEAEPTKHSFSPCWNSPAKKMDAG